MNGALILTLPGRLCAVMAWDLVRPGGTHPCRPIGFDRVDLRQRAVAGVLAATAGVALAAAQVLPLGALPAGATGAAALARISRPTERPRRPATAPARPTRRTEPA